MRGDYFVDRLGGWTEFLLATVSLLIVVSRLRKEPVLSDEILLVLFAAEIVGAILITRSKLPMMKVALWIFSLRVVAGLGYMSVVHGDKLARSTLGFPIVVAIYCFTRIRALRLRP